MSTNINDLPISSQTISQEQNNISLNINENGNIKIDDKLALMQQSRDNDLNINNNQNETQAIQNSLDSNINEFVSSIQKASADGMLSLPSRDIPTNETHLVQDAETSCDFIPNNNKNDYIKNEISKDDIINNNIIKQDHELFINNIYNDIHIPILIGIVFFIFNLPIINKTILKLMPFLFKNDINLNLFGYIFKSGLFSFICFSLLYGIKYFSI